MITHVSITFVLPGSGHVPVGGFKVVYRYANGLATLGYRVSVVHPAILLKTATLTHRLKGFARYIRGQATRSYRPDGWFRLDPRVQVLWVPSLHPRYIPDADIVVATAAPTAEWVKDYPPSKGKKLYLIQGLETWSRIGRERVLHTWKLPMRKIVIARWLQEVAVSLGEQAEYIPNGLEFGIFGLDIPPEVRNPFCVMMLYHHAKLKGSEDGLKAFEIVKREIPDLRVILFGVPKKPSGLPEWITYYRKPPPKVLRQLYNKAAIFVAPSWEEGWGLPASEALMCGAALVATDVGGHREFAIHEETALLSPPRSPEALAKNISRLIREPELRLRLARAGHLYVQQFTWGRAVSLFERVIREELSPKSHV